MFKTVITKSVRLEESPAYKESIFTFAPDSTGRDRVLQPVRGGHRPCRSEDCPTRCGCATTSTTSRRWRRRPATPVGRMVPIDLIDPNPNQPRQVMGDLSELMASIAEKGIIEPLVVRPARRPVTRSSPASAATRRRSRSACASCRSSSATSTTPRSGARAGREPPAQGPDAVRRSRGAARAGRQLRLHARGPGAAAGEVADVDHRVAGAERRCPRRSETSVGWPTFPLSRCSYR